MPEAPRRKPPRTGIAITRLTIPGAHALAQDELLRAAGFALARELSLERERLHLAVRKPQQATGQPDDCLIAWTLDASSSTAWLGLADSNTLWWLPGIAIGPGGSTELPEDELGTTLPPALLMLVAASPQAKRVVLVDPPESQAAQIELLQASTGLPVERISSTALPRAANDVLRPVPPAPERKDWQGLDYALLACAVSAGLLLAVNLAASLTAVPHATANSAQAPSGGELLLRALSAAPVLTEGLQQADYETPAWILVARTPAQEDQALEAALRRNGLSLQMVRQGEELRLRLRGQP